jgi:hypothetical protein
MRITLELDEEQSQVLLCALGRAWADAMLRGHNQPAERILALQQLILKQQQDALTLVRKG